MISLSDIKAAQIGGSDDRGFQVTINHLLPGNFGQQRLAKRVLTERFQRVESAKAFLRNMGLAENQISVEPTATI